MGGGAAAALPFANRLALWVSIKTQSKLAQLEKVGGLGGWGGGGAHPPFANFNARMMGFKGIICFQATLHGLRSGGLGGRSSPHLQTQASPDDHRS